MAGLFGYGLVSPQEVRASLNNRLFGSLPQYGGPLGPAYTGMAKVGAMFGSMLAGQHPEEQRAMQRQQIGLQLIDEMGMPDKADPIQYRNFGMKYAQALQQAGLVDDAFTVMGSLPKSDDSDQRKEVRMAERPIVKELDKEAAEYVGQYKSLERVSEQARKGSRSARGAMTIQAARLLSTGQVTDEDAAKVAGAPSPEQAMIAILQQKGETAAAKILENALDPFGDTFKVDDVLAIAQAAILEKTQPILNRLEDSKARAAYLTERGMTEVYGGTRNIDALFKMKNRVQEQQKAAKARADYGL